MLFYYYSQFKYIFHCDKNMHKSVYAIGLLASSLVMLAIMPFLNQSNSFLLKSAMAQEYDTDHYERYAMDGMVANEYESYEDDNYYQEAYPDYYPSSYNEDYRSYPSDDNYDKSHDKSNKISSISENNCINVNNINAGTIGNINAGSSSGELVAAGTEEENNGERYSDYGYNNKKGSDFDCIINNSNNNVGIGDGKGVGDEFCILESLDGCFQQHVDESKLEILKEAFEVE